MCLINLDELTDSGAHSTIHHPLPDTLAGTEVFVLHSPSIDRKARPLSQGRWEVGLSRLRAGS